jgi:hypothetical protein
MHRLFAITSLAEFRFKRQKVLDIKNAEHCSCHSFPPRLGPNCEPASIRWIDLDIAVHYLLAPGKDLIRSFFTRVTRHSFALSVPGLGADLEDGSRKTDSVPEHFGS